MLFICQSRYLGLSLLFPGFLSVRIPLTLFSNPNEACLQILPSGGQRVSDEDAVGICQMTQKGQLAHPSKMTKKPREGRDYLTPEGLPANKGTSVGSGLLMSYIMNLNFS